jgi:hypothetical protein
MPGRLVRSYPSEIVEPFVDEVQKDPELWAILLDRELERNELEDLGTRLGKRHDFEPEAFPPLRRPTNIEAISEFLKKKYSRKDLLLVSQIAGIAAVRARRELGLER